MDEQIPAEFSDAVSSTLAVCINLIAQGTDYPPYVKRLRDFHAIQPDGVRELFTWPAALGIAREVWRQTPHPAYDFALPKLPKPQRNAPCHCGSGLKYKQCCLPLEQKAHGMLSDDICFLPQLLEHLPKTRWPELASSHVSIDMMAYAASQMAVDKDVCKLLEPWFAKDADFHGKRSPLFDILLDAYDNVPHPRKKARLLDRAMTMGDRQLRSTALQRQAMLTADQGNWADAWSFFVAAQRENPNDPSLAHLEVILLINEGREREARERARFWQRRLANRQDPELEMLQDFLAAVVERGNLGLVEHIPVLSELMQAVNEAPPPSAEYTLAPHEDDAGPLEPTPALGRALQTWFSTMSPIMHSPLQWQDESMDITPEDWIPLLRQQPRLWNAFEVLKIVISTLQDYGPPELVGSTIKTLLERAATLLELVIASQDAQGKTLEWGWLENRSALHLLGMGIASDDISGPIDEKRLQRMEWLVYTLNPNDNQGFRELLMHAYLQQGQTQKALKLSDLYPDEFGAMAYGRALALYASDQKGAPLKALQSAYESSPKHLTWLLKTNPKPPARSSDFGIIMGSDEEAWLYRDSALGLWQSHGAMDWLKSAAKALRKK